MALIGPTAESFQQVVALFGDTAPDSQSRLLAIMERQSPDVRHALLMELCCRKETYLGDGMELMFELAQVLGVEDKLVVTGMVKFAMSRYQGGVLTPDPGLGHTITNWLLDYKHMATRIDIGERSHGNVAEFLIEAWANEGICPRLLRSVCHDLSREWTADLLSRFLARGGTLAPSNGQGELVAIHARQLDGPSPAGLLLGLLDCGAPWQQALDTLPDGPVRNLIVEHPMARRAMLSGLLEPTPRQSNKPLKM